MCILRYLVVRYHNFCNLEKNVNNCQIKVMEFLILFFLFFCIVEIFH